MLFRLLSLVIGYIFGLFQTSYIFGKRHGLDIRTKGSGNAGMTNTMRVFGKKAGALVLICDALKCFLAFYAAYYLLGRGQSDPGILYGVYAGAGAMLGHDFPFYMGFKGGKGLACFGGTVLAINYVMFIILFIPGLFIAIITDYICFAPITMAFIVPITIGIVYKTWVPSAIMAVASVAMLYKHRQNIERIRSGEELRFHFLWRRKDESERFGVIDDGKDIFNREVK